MRADGVRGWLGTRGSASLSSNSGRVSEAGKHEQTAPGELCARFTLLLGTLFFDAGSMGP